MAAEILSEHVPLVSVQSEVIYPNVSLFIMYFIYGFYAFLFGLCVYILRRGPAFHLQNPYMWITAILFVTSTCMVAAETVVMIHTAVMFFNSTKTRDFLPLSNYLEHDTFKTPLHALTSLLPVIANVAADFILIHRCYIVWQNSKRVLVPLVLTSFAVNAVNTAGAIIVIMGSRDPHIAFNRVPFQKGQTVSATGIVISASFHLIITSLTAGRIWWISRPVQRFEASGSLNRKYRTVVRIILESGMLYPLVIIAHLSITKGLPPDQLPFDFFPLVVLAAGIAPTLIIVRARLGMSVVNDIPSCSVMSFHIPNTSTSQNTPEVEGSDP